MRCFAASAVAGMAEAVHIVGARPNFLKAAPVVGPRARRGAKPVLIHTGQHFDEGLSRVFFDELGLPEPDLNLGIGSGSHATQTAALMVALESAFLDLQPSSVVVYGDVNSTLAAAVVAAKLEIPVAHVEAGLRSFDRSMPEEINRVVTDAVAADHLVTSPEGVDHLAREGISGEGVALVGNPMIDTLERFRVRFEPDRSREAHGLPERYGVATLHRPANVDSPANAARLVAAFEGVARLLPMIIPLHPRGAAALRAAGLGDVAGVTITEPMGYLEFMSLVVGAAVVLTDSGGVQEETTVLGVPCLTMRDNTERPITVTLGTNRLVGTDPEVIVAATESVLAAPPKGQRPPLWDGEAGGRIADVLVSRLP
jgi:UDP-N-acetylglucosamine 2-epimerase (non-hydrolysing)